MSWLLICWLILLIFGHDDLFETNSRRQTDGFFQLYNVAPRLSSDMAFFAQVFRHSLRESLELLRSNLKHSEQLPGCQTDDLFHGKFCGSFGIEVIP